MICKESFTQEHLNDIRTRIPSDPAILERTLYALALLEALIRAETPLVFKGGTSLLLLLEQPQRLSTDIDIVIEPGTDITRYIQKAATIFPFTSYVQQKRKENNRIQKQHFKFYYHSLIQEREQSIILDVLYERLSYQSLVNKKICHPFLKTEEPLVEVNIPSVDCILGDKLTAFAPYTTGINFGIDKELEIIKQLFDIATLFDAHVRYQDVVATYHTMATKELFYREMAIPIEQVLEDTIDAAACIASRGRYRKEDYQQYLVGIRALSSHIYGQQFNAEKAVLSAAKTMYLAACILKNIPFQRIDEHRRYKDADLSSSPFVALSKVRKFDVEAFAYIVNAIRTLEL